MKHDDLILSHQSEVSEADFREKLLHAERLLAASEVERERLGLVSVVLSVLCLAALFLLIGGTVTLVRAKGGATIGLAVLAAALVLAFAGVQLWFTSVRELRERIRRDDAAVGDLVDLLRASWPPLAESPGTSFASRTELEARLSRFPIAPSEPHPG